MIYVDFEETPEAIITKIVNITNELNSDVNNKDIELMQSHAKPISNYKRRIK